MKKSKHIILLACSFAFVATTAISIFQPKRAEAEIFAVPGPANILAISPASPITLNALTTTLTLAFPYKLDRDVQVSVETSGFLDKSVTPSQILSTSFYNYRDLKADYAVAFLGVRGAGHGDISNFSSTTQSVQIQLAMDTSFGKAPEAGRLAGLWASIFYTDNGGAKQRVNMYLGTAVMGNIPVDTTSAPTGGDGSTAPSVPTKTPTPAASTPAKAEVSSISALQSLIPGSNISIAGKIPVVISYLFIIIALCAFLSLIYSGFMYITAGGDASQVEKAHKNITWAITGIIISLLSYLIVLLVPVLIIRGLPTGSTNTGTTTDTGSTNNTPALSYKLTDSNGNALGDTIIGSASKTDFLTDVCIKLAAQPSASQGIDVTTDGNLPLSLGASQISMTPDNWVTPQCVSVAYRGNGQPGQSGEVIVKYAQDTAQRLKFTTSGVAATPPIGGQTTAQPYMIFSGSGRSATIYDLAANDTQKIDVTLQSQPTADVTVTITLSGSAPLTFSPKTLTFTAQNWQTAQTVTVNYVGGTGTAEQIGTITVANGSNNDSLSIFL